MTFVFTGTESRYFPALGDVVPGQKVDSAENPDPLWFAPAKPDKPAKADTTTEKE